MPKPTIGLLSLSVSVSCLVFMLFIVFCLIFMEKKKKIIAEIDLLIKNYESADFNKLLHPEKNKKEV